MVYPVSCVDGSAPFGVSTLICNVCSPSLRNVPAQLGTSMFGNSCGSISLSASFPFSFIVGMFMVMTGSP